MARTKDTPKRTLQPIDDGLEDKVRAGLDALNEGGDVAEALEEFEQAAPDPDSEPDEAEVVDEAEGADDETEEAAAPPADDASDADAPTLPEDYRRTLRAYDWTDEEIAEIDLDDPKQMRSIDRLHQNRLAESNRWAELGRRAKEQSQAASGEETPDEGGEPPALETLSRDQFREKFGEDEALEAVLNHLNPVIEQVRRASKQVQAGQVQVDQAAANQLASTLDNFFAGQSQAYGDFYGTSTDSLTDEQVKHRREVIEFADDFFAGAEATGRPVTVDEALIRAHDVVAGPVKEATIRKDIQSQIKKRSRGITQKPSGARSEPEYTGKPRNEAELLARTKSRMRAAFGG